MHQIDSNKVKIIMQNIEELERLLTETIHDIHDQKGMSLQKHAFTYYRKLLWEAKNTMRDSLNEI